MEASAQAQAYPSILSVEAGSTAQDVVITWSPSGTEDPRDYGIEVFEAIAEGFVVAGEICREHNG